MASWGPISVVLLAFTAAAFVIPTLAPVATTDDWGYTRSVQILYREGDLTVFPVVAATAVFQIFWGWAFAHLLGGLTLAVMRISTLVMVGIGGVALYGLLRELGVGAGRAALGVAAYLFNPLTFILSYTFMTDPHFTSLLVISTALYVRGLRDDRLAQWATVAGSSIAGCAFLTRQQGALIPFAVVLFLLLSRRVGWTRRTLALLIRVTALPAIAVIGYYLWLRYGNDVPDVQQSFAAEVRSAGVGGLWRLTRNLTFIALIYLGFFLLPLIAAVVPGLRQMVTSLRPRGWLLFAVWEAILIAGLAIYGTHGKRMPYIGQFVGSGGLGPPDVRGSRPRLFTAHQLENITVVCGIAAILVAFLMSRVVSGLPDRDRAKIGLVTSIALWQAIGVLPPSVHYLRRGYSLDRYLLPLLPLGICLTLWAVRDLKFWQPVGWLIVAAFAAYSISATRDYLVYMDAVWTMAREANAAGVANERLDAGAAWDGYHLYTLGLDQGITKARSSKGPWWVYFYGKPTDSSYVVSGRPLTGFVVVWDRDYSSWLETEPTRLYLLRRAGVAGPP